MPMNRLVLAVAIVLLLIFTVRVTDPEFLENHPEIDFSEDPGEIASDSVANLGGWDYTYIQVSKRKNISTGEWDNVSLFKYKFDNTGERISGWLNLGKEPNDTIEAFAGEDQESVGREWVARTYITSGGSWVNDGYGGWRFARRSLTYEPTSNSLVNSVWSVEECGWDVIRNDSMMVLECDEGRGIGNVTGLSTDVIDNSSYARIYIDKEEEHLSRMVLRRLSNDFIDKLDEMQDRRRQNGTDASNSSVKKTYTYIIHNYTDFGTTQVRKPGGVPPFSFEGLLLDIIQS